MDEVVPPTTEPASSRDGLFAISVGIACMAVLFAVVGMALALRAIDENGDVEAGAGGASSTASVSLSDFSITDATVAAGGTVHVTNEGAVDHNYVVEGTDLRTADLAAGESEHLALGDLAAGTYTVFCEIPGHREAGMEASLEVTESANGEHAAAGGATATHEMSAEEMDEVMHAVVEAFPAETAGKGGEVLEPTVLPDGTKRWELTAEIVDWEVEPGKVVQAWTYNGTVPGPTLEADIGDRVQIVLHNELPQSTSIHFHGLLTPNSMDGVPDITQEPVKPGETFTYEFEAKGPAVGMYHSHHNAQEQVPDGLAGTMLVGDIPLPAGTTISQEIPLMLNDAGVIGFALNGKSFPATAPYVVQQGEAVLIHYLNEGVQSHPMHLHGLPQLVVAKDGFPLPQPYEADTVNVAPGERYTVLVRATEPGVWAWHCHILPHAERSTGMFGMVTAMIVEEG